MNYLAVVEQFLEPKPHGCFDAIFELFPIFMMAKKNFVSP